MMHSIAKSCDFRCSVVQTLVSFEPLFPSPAGIAGHLLSVTMNCGCGRPPAGAAFRLLK